MLNKKQWILIAISTIGIAISVYIGINYGWWQCGCAALAISIFSTIIPIILGFLGFEELFDPGRWFHNAENLGEQQQRLIDHYGNIKGTLKFWKSKAAAHHRLHISRVIWSLISGIALPVLVQYYDKSNIWSVLFMTVLTTWTGMLVALAYTMKSEEKFQGFRQQESDYYDLSRKLLDFSKKDDPDLEKKVDEYISTVYKIRDVGRRVETSSPPSAL